MRLFFMSAALAAAAHARMLPAPPESSAPPTSSRKRSGGGLPVVAGVSAVLLGGAAAAMPAVRRSVVNAVRKLLDGDDPLADLGPDDMMAGAGPANAEAEPASQPIRNAAQADLGNGEQFTLTPEKLSAIAELNSKLKAIAPLLASVPVFTAAVGNGTSPLTVPTEDGQKLCYFFTERVDAEAFLSAVQENTKLELKATIIGVSLADIIAAYTTPEAQAARETFVIIPTMAEVAAARHIMRASGKAEAEQPALGPGNGLVPVFWCEALAVQTASGKQRKVLFLRLQDLRQMWEGLSDARKEQGEVDAMPEGPTVQVSDLQTMADLLVASNKTDDVMFLPSSNALKNARASQARPRGGGGAGHSAGPTSATGADESAAAADAAAEDDAGADASDNRSDDGASEMGVDGFEGDEEDGTTL